jgi:hypothetical protein
LSLVLWIVRKWFFDAIQGHTLGIPSTKVGIIILDALKVSKYGRRIFNLGNYQQNC